MSDNQDIVTEFLIESHENLERLENELLALEKDPAQPQVVGSIFRTIHTIKGTCGFLGFGKLEKVAHVGENLLSLLRDEELEYSPAIASGLLAMIDAVKLMLKIIETDGHDGNDEHPELIDRLTRLRNGESVAAPAPAPSAPAPSLRRSQAKSAVQPRVLSRSAQLRSVPAQPVEPTAPPPVSAPAAPAAPAAPGAPAAAAAAVAQHGASLADTTVRVDVALLDQLMNLVGELVLARNQIVQIAATQASQTLIATTQRLNLITADLQEGVMKTRMQAVGNVFTKFPRLCRDLSMACGKRIRVEMDGEDTEVDRTLLDAIKDPLTHLVRNAVDHGVETPDKRAARGKAPEGVLRLRAYHAGGQVNIEISDDGNGIDTNRIRDKVVSKGLCSADAAARLSERELIGFIFNPGFSTAEVVTSVSGRGVGMDVVKTNIERVGGTVDVETSPGRGTTFRVKIPLTLAIIPALIVTSSAERYAIPQISLLELVHLPGEQAMRAIERLHGVPVYRLRDRLLPLVNLDEVLEGRSGRAADADLDIVVVQAMDERFGLVVDAIHDTADIVVKPLGMHLKGLSTYAGATILGDGRVSLILDVLGVAKAAGVLGEVRDATVTDDQVRAALTAAQLEPLLLCRAGDGQVAIRLSSVARLEQIAASAVERVGNEEVVQYRGDIMPIARLSSIYPSGEMEGADGGVLPVVVYDDHGHSVGLVVGTILDIVHQEATVTRRSTRPGVAGSLVVKGKVAELIELETILDLAGVRGSHVRVEEEVAA